MIITHHHDLMQCSEEWFQLRCGMLTASEMHHIITPSGKPAKNDKMRSHAYDLLAQRMTGHIEPRYISDDMLRGHDDELDARLLYSEKYEHVHECGLIVRDFGEFRTEWEGLRIGYSPDGLVGDDGTIEVKGRRAKLQIETIINGGMPHEHMVQVQTGLLVSGRKWCDFISYSAGLPMAVFRADADESMQDAILYAAAAFEKFIGDAGTMFRNQVDVRRFHGTKRRVEQEMVI